MDISTDFFSLFCYGVALIFLGAGIANILGLGSIKADWARWRFPRGFNIITGGLEVAAAVLIVMPTTRLIGFGIMAAVMVGALATLIRHKEGPAHIAPATGLLFVVLIGLTLSFQ